MRDNQLIMKKQQHMQKQTNEEMKCIYTAKIFSCCEITKVCYEKTHILL